VTANAGTDAEVAVAAARAGAAVLRAMFGSALARYDKSGGDFATAADLEAEKAITEVIQAARPADAITGEESGSTGADGAERRWLVDPLCGTLNAAGIALCRAAGCTVTGIHGEPLRTGAGGLVAAADRQTHAALLEMIRDQTPPRP